MPDTYIMSLSNKRNWYQIKYFYDGHTYYFFIRCCLNKVLCWAWNDTVLNRFHPKDLIPFVFGKRIIKTSGISKWPNKWMKLESLKQKLDEFFMSGRGMRLFFLHRFFNLDPTKIKTLKCENSMALNIENGDRLRIFRKRHGLFLKNTRQRGCLFS